MKLNSLLTYGICFFLLISAFPLGVLAEENPPTDRGDGTFENSGDWVIEEGDDVQHVDTTIIINGNITIDGTLNLTRCHLIMNSSYSVITVNGVLELHETNVSGNAGYYYASIFGRLQAVDSHFSEIAGDGSAPYVGGLQLYSEDVEIIGGSIHHCEKTGLFVNTNVTISGFIVERNAFNVIVNNSAPVFIDCIMRYPEGSSFRLYNGADPTFIGGESGSYTIADDESSWSKGHRLNVHVTYENGTSISGATVTAVSKDSLASGQGVTDQNGWVRNMVLPQETVYRSQVDTVYSPYRVSATQFGLLVQASVQLESDVSVDLVLSGDYFGEALARGDFNGDGLLDLAVGVPRNTSGATNPGAVFIYFNDGSLELMELDESMADLIIPGEEGTDFGSVLASGDINGDGYDELFLSTPSSSENGDDSGMVYFFFGEEDPLWDSTGDALLSFDGESGSNYGRQMIIGDINGDEYDDFVIGDNWNSYVFYGSVDPVDDFTSVSEFTSRATDKGAADGTSQSVTLTKNNDDDRYQLNPQEEMHLVNFTTQILKGDPVEITLKFQFVTDRYYGYYEQERGYVYYSIDGENWHDSVRPVAPNNDWDEESTLSFDLLADGVTSLEDLTTFQLWYKNLEGQQGSDHYIHIDYVQIFVKAVPSGPETTLPPGNLSIGDVNGDDHMDLLVSNPVSQAVYFGGDEGISAPEIIEVADPSGTPSNIYSSEGSLTISETRPYLNGQFDDGWDGWSQVANTEGQKDGGNRWSIVEEENGDWKVHEGPTGSFGLDRDTLGGNQGRDCRGMLRTGDFLITDDMEMMHFWYHFKARSFEGLQDQDTIDRIRYALYSANNDSVLQELTGWYPTGGSADFEEDGLIDANISGLQGETVYFGMEIITNRGNRDQAIVQVDNLTISPPSDIPYYENGSFESDWFTFERNLTSINPTWTQSLNNGTISMKFRFNETENWSSLPDVLSGANIEVTQISDRFQYRVEMTGDTFQTPIIEDLSIGYLLSGEITPLYLGTEFGMVKLGDVDGDGIADILFLDDGDSRGQGIDLHVGSTDILEVYNISAFVDLYDGQVNSFDLMDIDSDDNMEIAVAGPGILIVNRTGEIIWELDSRGARLIGDVASDPEYELNTGAIYFLPANDNDLRIIDVDLPDLVQPDTTQSFNVSVGNLGVGAINGLDLFVNITASGYSDSFTDVVDLSSMMMKVYEFSWDVPEEEGVIYSVSIEAPLEDDRVQDDNEVEMDVTSMKHGVTMTSETPIASAHGGDELTYPIRLENIGTFSEEDVTLDIDIPVGWTGAFYHLEETVDSIIVTDSVDLTFKATSPADELNDDFTLNLSATAFTAVDWLDLTATILRPDLVVEDISLHREDGLRTNDTIHGVAGDSEVIRIKITNQGDTYSTPCVVELYELDTLLDTFPCPGLIPGESVLFTYDIIPEEGLLNITVKVDDDDVVPEKDEDNNEATVEFSIKNTDPVGDYVISGKIVNIYGEGVNLAEVGFEWIGFSDMIFTDENGSFSYTVESLNFTDTTLLYLNATDGVNITNEVIIMYSEDGGVQLILTLTQYLVELTGPDTISSIATGGSTMISLEVTNKGNSNATFVLVSSEIPEGWTMELVGYPDGKFILEVNGTTSIDVVITASADPLEAMGYHRYFITFMAYSERYPDANDTFTYGFQVDPARELQVIVVGEDSKDSIPYAEVSYLLTVENLGNVRDTFLPKVMGYVLESYSFDIQYADLGLDESLQFSIQFTMPLIATGTQVPLEVGSTEDHVTNAVVTTMALDYHNVYGEVNSGLNARPGDELSLPVEITNTGNLPETITIEPSSPREGLIAPSGDVDLIMGDDTIHILPVTIPEDALSGEVIPLTITLATDGSFSFDLIVNITVSSTYGMDLTILNKTIMPGIEFTTYHYVIEAVNTGNRENTFHFLTEGTHPHYVSPPAPLVLLPGEITEVEAMVIVPINQTVVIDNYLIPSDGNREFGDLNLRVLSYTMDLEIDQVTSQDAMGYLYEVQVMNNGTRFERLQLELHLPKVDSYGASDARWEGSMSKDVLELSPGETGTVMVIVRTPDLRENWGSDLYVTLSSDSRKSRDIGLAKPPIPILGESIEDLLPITIEDTLTFTGSQSLWNIVAYEWDLGDGNTDTGSTISHSFRKAGEYTVSLTVFDDIGFNASRSVTFEVSNTAPVASIVVTPSNRTVLVGQPIILDGSFSQDRDGEIVMYSWDFGSFGDFYEGAFSRIEHSYRQSGTYEVSLQVTDNLGEISNVSIIVYVEEKPIITDGGDQKPVEKVTTDILSYVPAVVLILILIIGAILIFNKRSSVKHARKKVQETERLNRLGIQRK